MRPICFISARGGSKGILKKNIRIIANKPLIAHTIESAINSDIFSHVVVSTEDSEIATISKKYGAEVPFLRPKRLAKDNSAVGDVWIHGIKKLYSLGYEFEIFVNRDCTVPFIRTQDIRGTISLLKKKKCDAVFGVYRQHLNPYFNMMELNSRGYLRLCKGDIKKRPKSRQKAPIVYQLNGLFTYYVKKFLKYGDPIVPKALPYEIPVETGLMIDTELEFQFAEMIFDQQKNVI